MRLLSCKFTQPHKNTFYSKYGGKPNEDLQFAWNPNQDLNPAPRARTREIKFRDNKL